MDTSAPAFHERPQGFSEKAANSTLIIPVDRIEADPENPRKHFDEVKLKELADSIAADGQLQPIGVRFHPDPVMRAQGIYMIVFGERRWRAHQLCGLPEIRAELQPELTTQQIRVRQYRENADRDNLNPVEEAEFLDKLLQNFVADGEPKPQERMAQEIRMEPSTLSRKLSVLRYSVPVRQLVRDGIITQVNALAKLNKLSPADQIELDNHARQLVRDGSKLDVASFLKDPQKYLKQLKGDLQDQEAPAVAKGAKAKIPAAFKTTWRLGRTELIKLAGVAGRPDLLEALQDSPDFELANAAEELREAIFGITVGNEPA